MTAKETADTTAKEIETKIAKTKGTEDTSAPTTTSAPVISDPVSAVEQIDQPNIATLADATTPPVSEDKTANDIEPATEPTHQIDESSPAGKSDALLTSTGRRTPDAENAYREHYARGWNDQAAGNNNIENYRGGGASTEAKSAYLAGWHGNARESTVGRTSGDMTRDYLDTARASGIARE